MKMSVNDWMILQNLNSGLSASKRKVRQLTKELQKVDIPFILEPTSSIQELNLAIQKATESKINQFIIVGGDGSLHQFINSYLKYTGDSKKIPTILNLPSGTGNDWNRGSSKCSGPKSIVQRISSGNISTLDIGKAYNDQQSFYFINELGIGYQANLVSAIESYKKKYRVGKLNYLLALFGEYNAKTTFDFALATNQLILETNSYFNATIGIGNFCGGGMQLTPHGINNDGQLALTLIETISLLKIAANAPKIFNGKLHQLSEIQRMDVVEIGFKSKVPIPVEADGEFQGLFDNLMFQNIPRAINTYV